MVAEEKYERQKYKDELVSAPARTLCSLIDGLAAHGTKLALVSFGRKDFSTFTYKKFVDQIRNKAAELQTQGIRKGDNIVFFALNSPAWIISALAVIYSGATVVPVDPQQSDKVFTHILEDSLAAWIFTDERGSKRLGKILSKSKSHHHIVRLDDELDIAESTSSIKSRFVPMSIAATDIVMLFYTSGTTGMPKGVPLNHVNMLLQLDSIVKLGLLKPQDKVLLPLPLFHVYPLNLGLFTPLMMGLPIILPHSLAGPEIVRSINEGGATIILSVPRLLRSLYQSIAASFNKNKIVGAGFKAVLAYCQCMDRIFGLRPGKILFAPLRKKFGPSLRLLACGGAHLEADLASKLRAFGWEVAVGYGLTETSPLLTVRMPGDRDLKGVGTTIAGVEVKIGALKEKDDQIDKDAGEILARGANVFAGYLNRPDLNKEVFTADGWFRTGDLGLFKKDRLHVIGRASSTIVLESGEKIQPDDIEDKFAKEPGIAEIGLLQVNHKLVALIVPDVQYIGGKDIKGVVSNAIKAASAGLASYLQITGFAITDEPLPRTNLGKIKRYELKSLFENAQA